MEGFTQGHDRPPVNGNIKTIRSGGSTVSINILCSDASIDVVFKQQLKFHSGNKLELLMFTRFTLIHYHI